VVELLTLCLADHMADQLADILADLFGQIPGCLIVKTSNSSRMPDLSKDHEDPYIKYR
jgi:hypothetical protein